MSSYEGPVEVVHDGGSASAHAVLATSAGGPLKEWGGQLHLDEEDLAVVFRRNMVTLRTDEGEGRAIPVSFAAGDDYVEVKGAGAPPWDLR